jgi:hypothetical protein
LFHCLSGVRFLSGNLLNDAGAIFLPAEPKDSFKELFNRRVGVGFIAVSADSEVGQENVPYAERQDP